MFCREGDRLPQRGDSWWPGAARDHLGGRSLLPLLPRARARRRCGVKIKVFSAPSVQELEAQVSVFLGENPGIEIRFVTQSESDAARHGWSATYTILYEGAGV